MKTVTTRRVRKVKAGLHSPYLTNEAGLQFLSSDDIMTGTDLCITKTCSVSSQKNNPESTLDLTPGLEKNWNVWRVHRFGNPAELEPCAQIYSFSLVRRASTKRRQRVGRKAVLDRVQQEYQPLAKLKTSFALGWLTLGLKVAFQTLCT